MEKLKIIFESSFIDSLEDVELTNVSLDATKRGINCMTIINIVCDVTNVTFENMQARKRTNELADARHLAMYFLQEYTDLTQGDIAIIFKRDRSTIVTGIQKIKRMNCSHCPDIQLKCITISNEINKVYFSNQESLF